MKNHSKDIFSYLHLDKYAFLLIIVVF